LKLLQELEVQLLQVGLDVVDVDGRWSGQQGGAPATVAANTGWWDTVKDPETKSWLQAKNFADPEIVPIGTGEPLERSLAGPVTGGS
jgi:hypothetical protein